MTVITVSCLFADTVVGRIRNAKGFIPLEILHIGYTVSMNNQS